MRMSIEDFVFLVIFVIFFWVRFGFLSIIKGDVYVRFIEFYVFLVYLQCWVVSNINYFWNIFINL